MDLCICPTAKTRVHIADNNNTCPTCEKGLVEEEPKYEIPIDSASKKEAEVNFDKLLQFFGNSAFGSTKSRANDSLRLKPPTFDGKVGTDPRHFFLKLQNYFETSNITGEDAKIRILKQVLDGAALDLYLASDEETQSDLQTLERLFIQYFKPIGHQI